MMVRSRGRASGVGQPTFVDASAIGKRQKASAMDCAIWENLLQLTCKTISQPWRSGNTKQLRDTRDYAASLEVLGTGGDGPHL